MRGGLILLFLVAVLLVSSCGQQTGQATNIGGVDVQFIENQPPSELRENAHFNVGLKLKNNLPEKVEDVAVCVSDSLSSEYGGISGKECQTVSISAAEHNENSISPEEVTLLFPQGGGYYYSGLEQGPDNTIILVDVTYPLQTKSRTDICLKQDPAYEVDEIQCEANMVFSGRSITSDFAPVTVDRIETSIVSEGTQNRIYADVHLRKASIGEVVSDGDQNLMGIRVSLGSGEIFDCDTEQEGYLEFEETTEEVNCDATVILEEAWQVDSLNVDLVYDYSIGLTHGPVPIKKLEEGLD